MYRWKHTWIRTSQTNQKTNLIQSLLGEMKWSGPLQVTLNEKLPNPIGFYRCWEWKNNLVLMFFLGGEERASGCLPGYAPPLLSFVEIDDNFSSATKRSVQTMRWKTPEFVSAPPRHSTERRKRALALFRVLRFAPINLQTDCAAMRQRQGKYLQLGWYEIVWKTLGLNL